MLIGGGGLKVIIIVTVTLYFNAFLPVRISVCRRTRLGVATLSGVTLYQGAPGSKFSKATLVEVLKTRVEHRICTNFLGSPGHVHPENV
jgi:hypothetical protein